MVDHFLACRRTESCELDHFATQLLLFCSILAVSRTDTPNDRRVAACALKYTAFLGFIIRNYIKTLKIYSM